MIFLFALLMGRNRKKIKVEIKVKCWSCQRDIIIEINDCADCYNRIECLGLSKPWCSTSFVKICRYCKKGVKGKHGKI